jgi:hypothetical protein
MLSDVPADVDVDVDVEVAMVTREKMARKRENQSWQGPKVSSHLQGGRGGVGSKKEGLTRSLAPQD